MVSYGYNDSYTVKNPRPIDRTTRAAALRKNRTHLLLAAADLLDGLRGVLELHQHGAQLCPADCVIRPLAAGCGTTAAAASIAVADGRPVVFCLAISSVGRLLGLQKVERKHRALGGSGEHEWYLWRQGSRKA